MSKTFWVGKNFKLNFFFCDFNFVFDFFKKNYKSLTVGVFALNPGFRQFFLISNVDLCVYKFHH